MGIIGNGGLTIFNSGSGGTITAQNLPVKFVDTVTGMATPSSVYVSGSDPTQPALGATLTASINSTLPNYNGVTSFVGMKILLTNQFTPAQNGDYVVTSIGSASSKWSMTRITYSSEGFYPSLWEVYQGTLIGNFYEQTTSTLNTSTIGTVGSIVFLNVTPTSASGIWGISNSSGVYTYYATLTLAMAAATSGQTIEMFADVTETGNVSISLKDNVNINGNGHTYTVTNTTASLYIFNNTLGSRVISNLTIFGNGVDASSNGFRTNTGNTTFNGVLIKMTAGYGCMTFGGGIIDGVTCRTTASATGIFVNGGYILNSRSYSVSGRAIDCSVGSGTLYNCHGESTSSVGIYGGYMRNCVGIGASSGITLQGGGGATDCTGISSAGYGILITGSSGLHSNLVAISSGLWALRVFATGIKINGFSAYSTAGFGLVSGFDAVLTNGYAESTSTAAFASDGGTYNNVYAKCTWNNASGHALNVSGNGIQLINCTFDVTNTSANCINASSAYLTKYMRSTFKGATTPINANITQGQINTEDNQGNILI